MSVGNKASRMNYFCFTLAFALANLIFASGAKMSYWQCLCYIFLRLLMCEMVISITLLIVLPAKVIELHLP